MEKALWRAEKLKSCGKIIGICILMMRVLTSMVIKNKGIGDAGSTADLRMLWSAIVCLGLGLL